MSETIWQPGLVLAIHLNRQAPTAHFVQMATVRPDGRPASRMLVFRGFLNETANLTFATDLRSSKIADLSGAPWAEICWYFAVTHEQFRIGGLITVVDGATTDAVLADARRECWRALPESTRVSFTWPPPGQRRDSTVPFPTDHPSPDVPHDHFGLLVLDPQVVDHLEINGHPQNRWHYRRDQEGRWSGLELNP